MKGLVFDHEAAVRPSVISSSMIALSTGLLEKSRVVRRLAANSTHCSFVITLEIYLWLNRYKANPRSAMTEPRQVRPRTEGWKQLKDADGKPLLQFEERAKKPPVHLVDLTVEERAAKVKELGLPAFRAKQLATHYFTHYTSNPADMSDLPANGREELVGAMLPPLLTEVRRLQTDNGDTIKFLWRLFDGALVESVLMRYPGRITLCVSSQAGCGMNCPFCATGQAGLTRNMSAAEIIDQVVQANRAIANGELRGGNKDNDNPERVSNIGSSVRAISSATVLIPSRFRQL
jgi:23S rRNA (adenine2503-C2)-methyltransferase